MYDRIISLRVEEWANKTSLILPISFYQSAFSEASQVRGSRCIFVLGAEASKVRGSRCIFVLGAEASKVRGSRCMFVLGALRLSLSLQYFYV